MYFSGLTKCFTCEKSEFLSPSEASNWRAIKAEKKIYYFCTKCQPIKGMSATEEDWKDFYVNAVSKIYYADFNRPIRKLMILRDVGGNPQIINANLN